MGEDLRARLRRLRREGAQEAPSSPEPIQPASLADGACDPARREESESSSRPVEARDSAGAEDHEAARDRVAPSAPAAGAVAARSAFERLKRRAGPQSEVPVEGTRPAGDRSSNFDEREARAPAAFERPKPRGELSWGPPAGLGASGSTLARTTLIPREHVHGEVRLERFLGLDAAHLALLAKDERLAACDLSRALFLDTETSGLSGGAGTYVWLVGLGRFLEGDDGRFELWQGFLSHPAEERELLAEAATRIAGASCLVTFFGKSFDRHRLEDKMRLFGVEPPFARVPHLDLYWPLRRAHRGKWSDCRLKTLEREVCGVRRVDDLPGSFAPAAWFDFLASRPHRLEGVFRHNADDILSLVSLATRA